MKNNIRRTIILVITALLVLFVVWTRFPFPNIKDGVICDHDNLLNLMNDISYYISFISIIVFIILTIVFIKKSDKFFEKYILLSLVFIVIIPIGISIMAGIIKSNDNCRIGSPWKEINNLEKEYENE